MPFSQQVAAEVLVLCARRCCICRRFCGTKMQLHHITPESEGGPDTADNCIPLCFDCHEEVGSYNPAHPMGRKFTVEELKRHRDIWFEFVRSHPERLSNSFDSLFRRQPELAASNQDIMVRVEPFYQEATILTPGKGEQRKEVFFAKVRNQGGRSIFKDTMGFTVGDKRYPGLFSPYGSGRDDDEIPSGKSQVFSFYGVEIESEDIPKVDGMYIVTGSGQEFITRDIDLSRTIREWQEEDDANQRDQSASDGISR
jgi:HNH endonuclease